MNVEDSCGTLSCHTTVPWTPAGTCTSLARSRHRGGAGGRLPALGYALSLALLPRNMSSLCAETTGQRGPGP